MSRTTYVLYDELVAQSSTIKTDADKRSAIIKLRSVVNGLDVTNAEHVAHSGALYSLMYHHAMLESASTSQKGAGKVPKIVYKGKPPRGGKGLIYHLSNIPEPLLLIMASYVSTYLA